MVLPIASTVSVALLLSVHFLLVCVLRIVRIPEKDWVGLVYLTFNTVVSLAFNAMIVSFLESVIYRISALVCLCFEKRSSRADDVLIAYYTKASKDIDAEARDREIILKSNLEIHAKMLECLQMLMDQRTAKTGAVSEKSDDAGVSEDEITISEEKLSPGNSIRSAASTE